MSLSLQASCICPWCKLAVDLIWRINPALVETGKSIEPLDVESAHIPGSYTNAFLDVHRVRGTATFQEGIFVGVSDVEKKW